MHDHDVSTGHGDVSRAQALWTSDSPEAAAFEQHASEGCSVCARALVNAREMAVSLALNEARPEHGRARGALLDRTRATLATRRAAATPDERFRALDPSAVVAHKHIANPAEEGRIREVDELRAMTPRPGEGTARMLAQLARFVDFSAFIVSIVRGDRVGYRVQRGLPEAFGAMRELRREMSYCTHCVSAGAPLIIENAFVEAFFRGNKAATRFGVAAYAGVPLRSAGGIVIGTLCALHFTPRSISPATVAVLEVFARRAIAEIERERTPDLHSAIVEATSERGDVTSATFFRDLLEAEQSRPAASGTSALVALHAAHPAVVLAWIEEHEAVGRIDETSFGILLPGAGSTSANERFARLRSVAGGAAIGFATAAPAEQTASWIARALRRG